MRFRLASPQGGAYKANRYDNTRDLRGMASPDRLGLARPYFAALIASMWTLFLLASEVAVTVT